MNRKKKKLTYIIVNGSRFPTMLVMECTGGVVSRDLPLKDKDVWVKSLSRRGATLTIFECDFFL